MRSYITNETHLTTKQVRIINKTDFVIPALNAESKTFVVYVAIWEREKMLVHLKRQA